jgi:two-component system, NarL family, invasion response regulator UvrY
MRVVVVDDHPAFRSAARAVIRATHGFELVGEATSGEEAIGLVEALRPDLVLMDVNMPGIGGVEATRRIVESCPRRIVALISSDREEDLPGGARWCGATAWLRKEHFAPATLAELLRGPLAGGR